MPSTPARLLALLATLVACAGSQARPTALSFAPQVDAPRLPVGRSPSLGRPDALVTIVEFGDLTAASTARTEAALLRVRLAYGDDVRIVWKHRPAGGRDACPTLMAEASLEALAQRGPEGFWRFHDAALDNLEDCDEDAVDRVAARAGVNAERLHAALQEHVHQAAIGDDLDLAERLEVDDSPELYVNGARLSGEVTTERLRAAVERAREAARAVTPREQAYAQAVAAAGQRVEQAQRRGFRCRADVDGEERRAQADSDRIPVRQAPMMGCPDALVTVVVFSDFQCPFCQRVTETLDGLRARYGADLRLVWRNNPLPFHDHARLAAEAAMEAHAQRGDAGFWRFHDALFSDQEHLERSDLEAVAERQGLDMERFNRALDEHTHEPAIARDQELAQRLNAQGTPNFFINGTNLVGAQPPARFEALIDDVLARARDVEPRHRAYAEMVREPVAGADEAPNGPPTPPPGSPAGVVRKHVAVAHTRARRRHHRRHRIAPRRIVCRGFVRRRRPRVAIHLHQHKSRRVVRLLHHVEPRDARLPHARVRVGQRGCFERLDALRLHLHLHMDDQHGKSPPSLRASGRHAMPKSRGKSGRIFRRATSSLARLRPSPTMRALR